MNLFRSKEFKNASWLIGGRIFQMILSLVVGVLTARYLGPSNYGLIGYASSYVSIFTIICNLGINSIIIKELIDVPEDQGVTLGTTMLLRFISGVLSTISITILVSLIDYSEEMTIAVSFVCSLALIFHFLDSINYWFQSKYLSKVTAIITLVAYAFISIYKIVLLIFGKSVVWFAASSALDHLFIGCLLFIAYKRSGGPKLLFSLKKAKYMLSRSYHYILSGIMVCLYTQTDKLMIKQMMSEIEVGYYVTAQTVCTMWVFILTAIIDSLYPSIMKLYKENKKNFQVKNRQLYCIIFYISLFVSLMFLIFGRIVIHILYGNDYISAVVPMKIITFLIGFSYLGVARNAWIVCENNQKYLKYIYIISFFINVILNLILIPKFGVSGAAIASLITEIMSCICVPLLFKKMRYNVKLMIEAICFIKIK